MVAAIDKASTTAANNKGPVDKTPIPGVDISKLSSSKTDRFYKLVGVLASPCGKSHSLRTSLLEDDSCKRAPFAARYVAGGVGGASLGTGQLSLSPRHFGGERARVDGK